MTDDPDDIIADLNDDLQYCEEQLSNCPTARSAYGSFTADLTLLLADLIDRIEHRHDAEAWLLGRIGTLLDLAAQWPKQPPKPD